MDYTFTDPPSRGKRTAYDWESIYARLREHPGEWLWLTRSHTGYISTYNAVMQGSIKSFRPEMGIEMRTANNDFKVSPRTCDIFVRYQPERDEALTREERAAAVRLMRKRAREKEQSMKVSTVESEEG